MFPTKCGSLVLLYGAFGLDFTYGRRVEQEIGRLDERISYGDDGIVQDIYTLGMQLLNDKKTMPIWQSQSAMKKPSAPMLSPFQPFHVTPNFYQVASLYKV